MKCPSQEWQRLSVGPLLLRDLQKDPASPVWCLLGFLCSQHRVMKASSLTAAAQSGSHRLYLAYLIFFWIFCHCLQMSRKKLECFVMMFRQVMNLEHIIFRMDLNAVFELHLPNKKEYLLIFLTFSAGLEGLPYDWPQWSQRIYLVVVGIREQINLHRWTAFPFPQGLILNHNLKCVRFLSIFKI